MKSCIYTGQVRHRRFAPIQHGFEYKIFMMYVDLAELPELFTKRWFWSTNKFTLAWFRRADHYGNPVVKLDQSIRKLVQKETGKRPRGPIRLLTHFRYFGYCFNPVSFYYCFNESDTQVETIVAEVNNTPWREQHCYVLSEKLNEGNGRNKRYRFGKDFHVSPFMDINIGYDWRFMKPDQLLSVHMENHQKHGNSGKKIFDATMVMKRKPMTPLGLATVLINFPIMTGKVISAVYWQAFKMWVKGFPFIEHPKHRLKTLNSQPKSEKL